MKVTLQAGPSQAILKAEASRLRRFGETDFACLEARAKRERSLAGCSGRFPQLAG